MDWNSDHADAEDGDMISMGPRWQVPRPPRPVVVTSAIVVALACGAGIAYAVMQSGGAGTGHATGPGETGVGPGDAVPAVSPSSIAIKTANGAKVYVPGRGMRFVRAFPVASTSRGSGR
jgi:hypothetical protein